MSSPPQVSAVPLGGPDAQPPPEWVPRRVLLVTGSLGEGHHAAARAVEERARGLWDGVEVVWADTLDGMGRGTGPAFRRVYAGCVRHLPGLYALYHRLLCRVPPFRAGTRAVVGAWSARGLAAALARHRPDLVVATFPEGITGLARLRRQGRLPVPAVALVTDPAPHPLWIGPELDLHLVSTPAGAELLGRWAPGARVRVSAPPVVRAFRPPPGRPLPQRPRVLVSCGSMAFGDVPALCAAVLDAGADALVSTGRDPDLRRRLDRLAATHPHGPALQVRDWIDDPAPATRHADVVVTNAGGATALEAIACARPLLLVDPVPGHGRANAAVLTAAGLARTCHGARALADAVRELADPDRHAAAVAALRAHLDGVDLDADVAALAALPRPASTERMRAEDAFFVAAQTPRVPQLVGAVIVLDPPDPGPRPGAPDPVDWPRYLAELVRERAPRIDLLTYAAAPDEPDRWRRVAEPSADRHVRPQVLSVGAGGPFRGWDDAAEAFCGTAIDPALGWEVAAAQDRDTGRVAILARVHHALGDGLVITDALVALLTDEAARTRSPVDRGPPAPAGPPPGRARARRAAVLVRGLAALATMRPTGRSPLTGPVSGPGHRRFGTWLDGREVRTAARAHGVGTTALILAVLADALHATFADAGTPTSRVRTMVPLTSRTTAGVPSRAAGNRMAVVPLDLPTGPMPPAERVARVAAALARASGGGRPEAAAAASAASARLPRLLRAPAVRLVHGRRFFHMVTSVMPGVRRATHVRGRLIREVFPVLPLAGGVGLAVGVLNWGPRTCVGITAEARLGPLVEGIPARLQASLRSMQQR